MADLSHFLILPAAAVPVAVLSFSLSKVRRVRDGIALRPMSPPNTEATGVATIRISQRDKSLPPER